GDGQGPVGRWGGRGWLAAIAGGVAVVEQVRSTQRRDLTLARLLELSAAGDPACRRAIADAGRQIGVSMAAVCNILNPELIIVGGHLSEAGDLLLGPLRSRCGATLCGLRRNQSASCAVSSVNGRKCWVRLHWCCSPPTGSSASA